MKRKLARNPYDRIFTGLCGGLGDYFGIDPVWFRLGFAFTFLAFGVGLILYLVASLIVPRGEM